MSLPRIMYGTAWKEGRTASLIVSAVIQGFRAIDTGMLHYSLKRNPLRAASLSAKTLQVRRTTMAQAYIHFI